MRITKNNVIDRKGNKTRRLRNPGADNVRRVMSKFVNEIVVLTPESITLIIAIS